MAQASDQSSTTGQISSGQPDLYASNTLDRLGGLLKSGPLRQMKGSGSYATLLERRVLMRIKMVDGSLAAVLVPASDCPAR